MQDARGQHEKTNRREDAEAFSRRLVMGILGIIDGCIAD